MPTPTPSHTPTPTPAATATPSQKPTAEPQPTSTAIQSPTSTPTPTPIAEEIAASRLSEIIPWFENPQTGSHGFGAELLIDLWLSNGDLGNKVAGFPWVTDSVTDGERNFVAALGRIARADLELAKTVANLHWVSDDVNDKERVTIQILDRIASEDIEFARRAVGFQWFAAEASVDNMMALSRLRKIGANNVDLAMLVVRSSWFEDGLTSDELISLGALWRMADNDHLELARNLAGSPLLAANQHRDLQVHALAFLGEMAASDPHALDQLTALPWFADGLDEEDMTLVVTLGWAAGKSPELYDDLLRTHYTQDRAASLPMAGDVNIWIFQNTPFPPDEDLSTVIEDTARISEGLLGVPFPTTDIILLVVDDVDRRYGSRLE